MLELNRIGEAARSAAFSLANASTAGKNRALAAIADSLVEHSPAILAANALDVEAGRQAGLSPSMVDRLSLTDARVRAMAEGVRDVMRLPDPVGRVLAGSTLDCGLQMEKIAVPLGVVGIIYEARPNVTSDAAAICLKSGNACVLRGGKEALNSNVEIARAMRAALISSGFDENCISLIEDPSREVAAAFMRLNRYIDCLIPRGGAGLIRSVVENATVPVIETGLGNCHVYVDALADFDMARAIVINAKTHRPAVCNACETVLVAKDIAEGFLPGCLEALRDLGVEVRGCPETKRLAPWVTPATDEDYATEYLDYILAVKVVNGLDEAIAHINRYGTGHSEAIVTNGYAQAQAFLQRVDAAAVYVNASTRFTDGGEFGFGAELGISTQKLHARGPMGLAELVTYKYVVEGSGEVRR
mgnify:CR=1 FL=1